VLWWKYYEEYEKRQAFSHTLNENTHTLSDSFNQTNETVSETFVEVNGTSGEMFGKSFSITNEFLIPLLFVGVDTENMFYTLSILASIFTVICFI